MPELPEVETIRRQLAPLVEGRTLQALEISDPRWCEPLPPAALVDALVGRRVEHLGRRGKYLIWEAQDDVALLMHLRMTGTLLYDAAEGTPYRRVLMTLDDGHTLSFCDPRRFGTGSSPSAPTPATTSSTPAWASSRSGPTSRPSTSASSPAGGGRR